MPLKTVIDALKKSRGTQILSVIDKHLLGRNGAIKEREAWIHPSGVRPAEDVCAREFFLYLWTPVEKLPESETEVSFMPRTYRIFDNGEHAHIRLQSYFIECGICDPRKGVGWEIPIRSVPHGITGHADAIIYPDAENEVELVRLSSGHGGSVPLINEGGFSYKIHSNRGKWIPKGEPILVDIKSIMSRLYQFLIGPTPKNLVQATCYCALKGLKRLCLLYECKDTQEIREFVQPLDRNLWAVVERALFEAQEAKKKKVLPRRICRSALEPRARKCDMMDICFGTKTYSELIQIENAQAKNFKAALRA